MVDGMEMGEHLKVMSYDILQCYRLSLYPMSRTIQCRSGRWLLCGFAGRFIAFCCYVTVYSCIWIIGILFLDLPVYYALRISNQVLGASYCGGNSAICREAWTDG